MTGGTGWDGILEPGERILWQGQPDARIAWADAVGPLTLMGALFSLFSLAWMGGAAMIVGGAGVGLPFALFPLFGLPFLAVGLYMLGGHAVLDAYLRSTTWYTLTDRTAFIATSAFGRRRLESYPIAAMPFLDLEDGAPGSILFARARQGASSGGGSRRAAAPGRVGFRRIAEARRLYGEMRGLRRAALAGSADRTRTEGA